MLGPLFFMISLGIWAMIAGYIVYAFLHARLKGPAYRDPRKLRKILKINSALFAAGLPLSIFLLSSIAGCENGCDDTSVVWPIIWSVAISVSIAVATYAAFRVALGYIASPATSRSTDEPKLHRVKSSSNFEKRVSSIGRIVLLGGIVFVAFTTFVVVINRVTNWIDGGKSLYNNLTIGKLTSTFYFFAIYLIILVLLLAVTRSIRDRLPGYIAKSLVILPVLLPVIFIVAEYERSLFDYGYTGYTAKLEAIRQSPDGTRTAYLEDLEPGVVITSCSDGLCQTAGSVEVDDQDVGKRVNIFAKRLKDGSYTMIDCTKCHMRLSTGPR